MNLILSLEDIFKQNANAERAVGQAAYMRNQFGFLGISNPDRAILEKDIFKRYPISTTQELVEILKLLWLKEEREFQYSACRLALHHKKLWSPEIFDTFKFMITNKSWWDTVDTVAPNLVGALLLKYPELKPTLDKWIADENMWLRRSALIHQLRYKNGTDYDRLFKYCKVRAHEEEFFIRKAIGWSLREYSKVNPDLVRDFVQQNCQNLSKLSVKEASKYI